ncbi:DEAD/DEAH box helicase [Sporomusa sphaeroides]|uniref:Type III restriction enzyme, res subunit n=1 Tax=Sporomusa sphaeroides DSM 2875 TaxID=1337886 RepID=A0ABM9W781_9FIRM|nr:DEAD/DEAH box helicase family protein [Sporomusa sphaeroides]OLS54743.1 type III restriction enzyme, res subunit [Sporomusa sphaeroides DSM 2875]CVK20108.1 Type III restriction enzyme, res subunit [Sporomusa sphaeroides DSM 2875]
MGIQLAEFQLRAIADLFDAMGSDKKEIILKSCTGSGKTIILTHFMDEYLKSFSNTVFIWLTPGKGDLEEQSKKKMDKYIYGSHTKTLADVMIAGFESGDVCFINWEILNKKSNNALKEGERTNFLEHIERAFDSDLCFKIIVDESHEGDTIKGKEIIDYFKTDKIIRASATPKTYTDAVWVTVPEAEVIAAGLIKKVLVINEGIKQGDEVEDQIDYLLTKALEKQRKLYAAFAQKGASINPLIVVQLPNKNDVLLDNVERWFAERHITYENGLLAVRLSGKYENLDDIDAPYAAPITIIIKQAIATGWDCPRAHILVKLRDHMSETFEIQTIGRIRRMPEQKHYDTPLLDSCYLFTLDEKFTESVRQSLGKGALEAAALYLREELKSIKLVSEQVSSIFSGRDQREALKAIYTYFMRHYNIDTRTIENKKRLEASGFLFSDFIRQYVAEESSIITAGESSSFKDINTTYIQESINTHKHGQEYHHIVFEIAAKVGLKYETLNAIFRRLFVRGVSRNGGQILLLENRQLYAFVLNNRERLKNIVREASAELITQLMLDLKTISDTISKKDFWIPRECYFTYDATEKAQRVYAKNVYKGYLSSAAPRSDPEKMFEKFCESTESVDWIYKNGDKGSEFFSIVYADAFGKPRVFFPDYVVSVNGEIWIIETKGGFDKYGNSQDIDKFSPLKFIALRNYLERYSLKGGFVRADKKSGELCICSEEYSDDISSTAWLLLSDIFK